MNQVRANNPDRVHRPSTPVVLAGAIALFAIVTDQLTKWMALDALTENRPLPLIGDFITLQLVRNSGAAFSLGANATWIFTALSTVIVIVICVLLPRVTHLPTAAAMGLLAGGAIGNLIDRVIQPPSIGQGHVIDFINYNEWFVGNVADIWIVVAAAWLAVMYAFSAPQDEHHPGEGAPPSTSIDEGDRG